jgi:tetratricopeptide (TPR) repeat protein
LSQFLYGNYLASLGQADQNQSLLTRSVSAFDQTLKLFPTFHPAALNQGRVFLKLGLPLEAKMAFEKTLAIQPYQPRANYLLSTILWSLGRKEEARDLFLRAVTIQPRIKKEIQSDPYLRALFPDISGLKSESENKP